MTKLSKISVAVLVFLLFHTSSFALSVNNGSSYYDTDSEIYHIEGGTAYANQPVKLEILKRGIGFDEFGGEDDLLYTGQIYSDESGLFSFDVSVTETGTFLCRVSELSDNSAYLSGFATYTEETVNNAIRDYIEKPGRTTEELDRLISDFYPNLNIDIALYQALNEQNKDDLLVRINSLNYPDISSFKKSVEYLTAEAIIFYEKDASARTLYAEKFANQLGIGGTDCYEDYLILGTDARISVISNILRDFPYDNFADNFENSFIIYKIDNALWNTVADIMDKYLDCNAGALFDGVSGSSKKTAVDSLKEAVKNKTITRASDMYDYLKSNIPEDNRKGNSGGSGGLGGSGGTKSYYGVPVSIPDDTAPLVNVPSENSKYFIDTKDVSWAEPAIEYLYKKGVINGKSENMFAPVDSVTREEFVKMIMLAFDFDIEPAECIFNDVDSKSWYYPYVCSAYDMKIISGESDERFGTGRLIKRQDAAQMIYNALLKCGADIGRSGELDFADKDDISDYAVKAMTVLSDMRCLNGDENGFVMPHKNLTRAEAAKIIYSVLTAVKR